MFLRRRVGRENGEGRHRFSKNEWPG
jgi:hypothetical protein